MSENKVTMDKIVNLCTGRGFIFAGSEIYGGLANTWDFGPLGILLKNNVKKAWWTKFVTQPTTNIGIDSAILMNPTTWRATGHLGGKFDDPLMDCRSCKSRHRADNLIEDYCAKKGVEFDCAKASNKEMEDFIEERKIVCPVCGNHDFTQIRQFNLLFKTFQGVTEDSTNTIYLRPETAQGIFVNFQNIVRSSRRRIPMGVGQIGKSFRNEITPGNFIFRVREFEQMELEFFCKPGTDLEWFDYWKNYCKQFLIDLGIKETNLRLRDHKPEELCFYSKATTDFEYLFPFGWGELWGIADRTDYDLMCHQKMCGKSMEYTDPVTQEKYVPYVIEPSLGVERMLLAFLCNAYEEEKLEGDDTRIVLKLHPALAPFKVAILPLQKKLGDKATELYTELAKEFDVDYDESGSIGKRYRRQDEIGTPLCVTVDFDTLEDNTVTIRNRDTMEQIRLPISELGNYIREFIKF
ncbi:MAG: glycine--tRNA ligase [Clostridia bacterium]|nr:glycine--tRNA ligase [Clostridia bacterium]